MARRFPVDGPDAPEPVKASRDYERDAEESLDALVAILAGLGLTAASLSLFGMNLIKRALDEVVVDASGAMVSVTAELIKGTVTIAQWKRRMRRLIVEATGAGVIAMNGGNLPEGDLFERWVSETDLQYGYLIRFFDEIKSGEQLLGQGAIARADLFARAVWGVGWRAWVVGVAARPPRAGDELWGLRNLGIADHCDGCIEEAAAGWRPIDEVIPIGETDCRARCHCSLEVRWASEMSLL